jgi:photosystem II stability/assembly factor-like uncharacterized protein
MNRLTKDMNSLEIFQIGKKTLWYVAAMMLFMWASSSTAQENREDFQYVHNPSQYESLEYRMIGPHRGGRVTAVAGTRHHTHTFYMGATGGGVWKTTDDGENWTNISDGYFDVGSIGAITVAPSDPNVIYTGTGSACPRGNISAGKGIYKSTDAGKSWSFIGLPEAGQIGRIAVHPKDEDLVYAAALGHIFGPNEQRGVFRSKDGGENWEKVLFAGDSTGAVDLALNPENPEEIYAALWRAERKPWAMISGGGEDGLYKSTDGGDTWTKLSNGLPEGTVGRIGVTVSPANPERVWALVEADEGEGLYRSDNAGKSFKPVNLEQKKLMARPWYYTHIYADPKDKNTVYIANEDFFKSVDGGRSFKEIPTPHGDNHDLWINPDNPQIMVEGNDGGANVSVNGGKSWSTQLNQPTAEFYSVVVDDQFPYRIYAPQQDNSTISIPSRISGGITPSEKWYSVGGCETGPIAVKPDNPDIVYAGCYGGRVSEWNKKTGQSRQIMRYPQLQLGQAERDLKYRYQWNSPITTSPHNSDILYHASQYLHKTTNGGQNWDIISPDLTRNDPSKEGYAGGPITHDITGVEIFGTIFAVTESPHEAGVIWAGSNDGLVHITRDGGENWIEVTPDVLPELTTINRIEASPHQAGKAYIAAYRYRYDDFTPYILVTEDYGESWELLTDGTNGIPEDYATRVVREDPQHSGLLYAGTEFGLFISFDDGVHWQPLQLNLPVSPVTDLKVHRNDLVVATQGRSLWILDDLEVLRQQNQEIASSDYYLYEPDAAYRVSESGWGVGGPRWGENPPSGAVFHYYLEEQPSEEVTLEILDSENKVIREYSSSIEDGSESSNQDTISAEAGAHGFSWDLQYPGPDVVESARPTDDDDIIWGELDGPRAVPGTYKVRLTVGDWSQTHSFAVKKDPRLETRTKALQQQHELAIEIRDVLTETHNALRTIRSVKKQLKDASYRLTEAGYSQSFQQQADSIRNSLTVLENELIETTDGDVAKLEPELSSQLAWLNGVVLSADAQPTDSSYERFEDLKKELNDHKNKLSSILDNQVTSFNQKIEEADAQTILVPEL